MSKAIVRVPGVRCQITVTETRLDPAVLSYDLVSGGDIFVLSFVVLILNYKVLLVWTYLWTYCVTYSRHLPLFIFAKMERKK